MQKKVIIAALDWGLGHATRMIEIVQYFIDNNWQPILASSGDAALLWRQKFPELITYELPAYDFKYNYKSMVANVVSQIPKINKAINKENIEIDKLVKEHSPDLIISDNRYGVYHPSVYSIFVTHQLQILPPDKLSFTEPILLKLHEKFISDFNQIWIPDYGGNNNLSGKLSHDINAYNNVKYIGPLSRFKSSAPNHIIEKKKLPRVLAILSGPEPSRSDFEDILLSQLKGYEGESVLLRGKPASEENIDTGKHKVYSHLDDKAFYNEIQNSDLIIMRSGYSSIMDIFRLKKIAVLVPTPGQTEQEYLANSLMKSSRFFMMPQSEFDLNTAIDNYTNYSGFDQNMEAISDSLTNDINMILKDIFKEK